MKLRVANKNDFADQWGRKTIGAMYFCQSATGAIEKQPRYFSEETDLATFRELYTHNQIYVPERLFEDVEIVEEKEEIPTNIKFFRSHKSAKDILENSQTFDKNVKDDSDVYDDTESCDIYAECGS